MPEFDLLVPRPTRYQAEIMEHPAKRKVIVAGRRAGKTHVGALIALENFFQYKKVLIVSTSEDQASQFWGKLRLWLHPLIKNKIVYKNENTRELIFRHPTNHLTVGVIKAKTGRNEDALRGGDADILLLDEAAFLEESAWKQVGLPMLLDRNGTAVFMTTPQRKNWIYSLYRRGLDDAYPNWKSWRFPTFANPYLSQEALTELLQDLEEDSDEYRQEILAHFLDTSGAVFKNIDLICSLPFVKDKGAIIVKPPYPSHFVGGVDWGQMNDFTVVAIMDKISGDVVFIDRFNNMSHTDMVDRVARDLKAYNARGIVETNSIGKPNFEALTKKDLKVEPFEMTRFTKPTLVQTLQLSFENLAIRLPNADTVKGEFEAYEGKYSARSFHTTYGAPSGLHDDIVTAVMLAEKGRLAHAMSDVW